MYDYTERAANYWQDCINVLLGLWLIIAPWVLGFAGQSLPVWNAWIVGAIIAVTAASALVSFQRWGEWVNAALGVWLVASPWILGFATMESWIWNQLIVGTIVAALAVWSFVDDHDDLGSKVSS